MNGKHMVWLATFGLTLGAGVAALAFDFTLHADADAHVAPESFNYLGQPVASYMYNYGGSTVLSSGGYYNGHPVVYLHFDISSLPRFKIVEARLKLNRSSHSWNGGGGSSQDIHVFGLMNDADEWDPATLLQGTGTGQDTPELDIAGTNAPARGPNGPELNGEGTSVSSVTRRLATQTCYGDTTPAEGYSIDADVTDFMNWAIGRNGTYSTYTNGNTHVTLAIHLSYRGSYPYLTVNWKSLENTASDPTDAPRLELKYASSGTVVVFR